MTRKHIFHEFTVTTDERENHGARLLSCFGRLLSSNPSLASYVRNVNLSNTSESENLSYPFGEVLDSLDDVTEFSLDYSQGAMSKPWSAIEPSVWLFLKRNPITNLYLSSILGLPPSAIHGLQYLKSFSCHDLLSSYLHPTSDLEVYSSTSILQHLDVWACDASGNLILPSKVFDLSHLSDISLEVRWGQPEEIIALRHILAALRSLRRLKIGPNSPWDASAYRHNLYSQLAPSYIHTLRVLDLAVASTHNSNPEDSPYGDIEGELSEFADSNSLEELHIHVRKNLLCTINTNPAAWNSLDTLLSNGFSSLKLVSITILLSIDSTSPEEILQVILQEGFIWLKQNTEFKSAITITDYDW